MKKLISMILAVVLCITAIGVIVPAYAAEADCTYNLIMTNYESLSSGYRQRAITTTAEDFSSSINADDLANNVLTKWITDPEVKWTTIKLSGSGGGYIQTNNGTTFNMFGYGDIVAADLQLLPEGKSVSAVTGGSTKMWAHELKGKTTDTTFAKTEVRYMVNAARSSYIAFGYDCSVQKAYYSIDGNKTYNATVWDKNHVASDDETNATATKKEYPWIVIDFSINGGTVNFTLTANEQNETPEWKGSFTLDDIAFRQASMVYPQEMWVDTVYDSRAMFSAVSLKYKTTDALVKNFERTSVTSSTQDTQLGVNATAVYTDPNGTAWSGVKHTGDAYARYNANGGDSGIVVNAYTGSASVDGVLALNGDDFKGLKSHFVQFELTNIATSDACPDPCIEIRYLVNSDRTKYVAFGVKLVDGVKTPYYQIDATGEKVFASAEMAAAIAYAGWARIEIAVAGNDISFKMAASADFPADKTWKGTISLSDMTSRINDCAAHRSYYVNLGWQKGAAFYKEKLSYYYAEVGEPTVTEDFEGFNAENSAYGFANRVSHKWDTAAGGPGEFVVAANENGRWERSRFLDGQDTSGQGKPHSSAYVVDEEDAEIALIGSTAYSGLNFYPEKEVWDMKRLEFEMSVANNKYNSVRFLVSDDEKSAYEIGMIREGKFYVVKRTKLWAMNYNWFDNGLVDATAVDDSYTGPTKMLPNTISSSVIVGDDGTGNYNQQAEHKFKVTIIVNDDGFEYKVVSVETGATVFSGTYVDPEGKRLVPAPGNPALQLASTYGFYPGAVSGSDYYSKQIVDDVKLWYTPVVEPNATYADNEIKVNIAPNQMGKNVAKMVIIAVQYNDSDEIMACEAQSVTDMTQGSTYVNFAKADGATKAKVLVWEGDAENVWPMLEESISVEL